jgi:hypothetical protein
MLRRIFVSKEKEEQESGEWRRWHFKGLHTLYCPPDIIRPKQAW